MDKRGEPDGPDGPPLRIGMIAPVSWRTPPGGYGPWELATHTLAEALVARGHALTLFAAAGSRTSGTLVATVPGALSESPHLDAKVQELRHVAAAFERAAEFDVLHSQADLVPLAFSRLTTTPLVATIHGLGSPEVQGRVLPIWRDYAPDVAYVAISEADRHPGLDYAATVHHGLDPTDWPFADPGPDAPLVFFGRMHPDKGPHEAIRIARAAGVPLAMAGIVHDEGYFRERVAPAIDGASVRFLGNVSGAARAATLGGARALLHPIGFDEPFGLSVIEAMACGTPTIAYRRGSMPELVEDGRTGFLVDGVEGAAAAVARVPELDRLAVRRAALERFTAARMAREYEALYRRVLAVRARADP